MSILQRLPESVTACGREYAINTDFRVWIEVEKLIFDKSVPYAERIAGMFVLALTEPLHWHKFKALLKSLGEGCKFSKIVGYRSTDTAKIKDKEQRRFYESMKRLYSLPDRRTDDEKEADLVEGLGMFF